MISRGFLSELRRIVGSEHARADDVSCALYAYDASLAEGRPDAVVFPADTQQTAAVMAAAARAGVPCVPRGFGTNLSGGSVAPRGGVVLCFTRMNRILAIEPDQRYAAAQPGVTNLELQTALARYGFFFAPDPASQKAATLGGNVAENAGGPHCVKYGVTTNHVLGLEIVRPGGEVLRVGGTALDPPGFDLRGLLVGSEGTLAAVTEVVVRILPKPEAVITLLAIYDSVDAAARSVSDIIARGIAPATLEMMDRPFLRAVEERLHCGYPQDAAAVLIIELEGLREGLRAEADEIQAVCRRRGCTRIQEARNDEERDQLWAGRRGAFGAVARLAANLYTADCTVPRSRLPDALEQAARIAERRGFRYGCVAHAGDGNLHPVLLFDGRDPDELHRVHLAGREIMEACVKLGGVLSGEHGVGLEKREEMRLLFSEESLEFQRRARGVFDPQGLMNPGKALPDLRSDARAAAPAAAATALGDELIPRDAAEARALASAAADAGRALAPEGRGRRADYGNAPSKPLTRLRSTGLNRILEFDPDNQLAVVEAGVRLADAQRAFAQAGQWLPVRPALADECTLGGVAALAAAGPERLLYGGPRDRVLGLRFVSGEGEEIAAGGRCVKNVCGYDVTRLLVGSLGALGFITELTLYLATRPEVCRAVEAEGSLAACAAAAAAILRSSLWPAFASAQPAGDAGWRLAVGFEGLEPTVRSQTARAAALIEKAGLRMAGEADYPADEGFHADAFRRIWSRAFVLRVDAPVGSCAALLEAAVPDALADFGCGRVTLGLDALSAAEWERWQAAAGALDGHAVVEKAPAEFKREVDVFGPPRPDWRLTHELKAALDPRGVFAPGRLPGRR